MWNSGIAGRGFDQAFFVLETVALTCGLAAVLGGRVLGAWTAWIAGAAAVLSVGTMACWYIAYPTRNGIEGAGRLLFGVPAVLVNLVVAGIALWRHFRR